MSVDLSQYQIETFANINDLPEPPTAIKAGNGAHVIQLWNNALPEIETGINDLESSTDDRISNLSSSVNNNISDLSNELALISTATGNNSVYLDNHIEAYNNNKNAVTERFVAVENKLPAFYPVTYTHWHQDSRIFVGAGLEYVLNPAQPYGFYSRQTLAEINSIFGFDALLKDGLYKLKLLSTAFADSGILSVKTDGNLASDTINLSTGVGDVNGFNATYEINILLLTSGIHTFRFEVTDKGNPTGDYGAPITRISLTLFPD